MAQTKRTQTTQQIADLLDLDPSTILNWAKAGLPHDKPKTRRHSCRFSEAEVAEWMAENGKTGDIGRPSKPRSDEEQELIIRKLKAQVEKAERENKQSAGLLIDAAEEQRRDVQKITSVRNRLCGLGATLAPQLEGLDGAERQTVIDTAIEEILMEFAR